MTMDVRRRCVETSPAFITSASPRQSPKSETPSPPVTISPPKPAVKRSFDVAFLMAPDDSSKKRHQEEIKEHIRLVSNVRYSPPDQTKIRYSEVPLGLLMPSKNDLEPRHDFQRSAFTKVTSPGRIDVSSISPVSPDLNYQDSLSPPTRERSPQYYKQYFSGKPLSPPYLYQIPKEKTREEFQYKNEEKGTSSKRAYPSDVLPYGGLPLTAGYPFPGGFATGSAPALLSAAAANVTAALLPPSLAALTLPAQNVCAKCNVSFRMTSDLVYHMRSQHKGDNAMVDNQRRRRDQDKLRCPVCNESFRERHHLTRHMTAHQDKDGDKVEEEETTRRRPNK